MLDIELDIINKELNRDYAAGDIYMDNNVIVEAVSGRRIELPCKVFSEIAKVKRIEHLKRISF